MVDGKVAFFAGSNNFFLALRHCHTPADVTSLGTYPFATKLLFHC